MLAQAPLMSIRARAQIGKTLTYQTRKGQNIISEKSRPTDPQSSAQLLQRQRIKRTVAFWKEQPFDTYNRECWRILASTRKWRMNEYQAFMKVNGPRPLTGHVLTGYAHRAHKYNPDMRAQIKFHDLNTGIGPGENVEVQMWLGESVGRIEHVGTGTVRPDGLLVTSWPYTTHSPLFYYCQTLDYELITGIYRIES